MFLRPFKAYVPLWFVIIVKNIKNKLKTLTIVFQFSDNIKALLKDFLHFDEKLLTPNRSLKSPCYCLLRWLII